ncbi:hypothetical protein BD414DRAFT_278005 [Trametes punicea]|nr:hypothetical protein BD414DRAFT_278005 [Trametes punicea]
MCLRCGRWPFMRISWRVWPAAASDVYSMSVLDDRWATPHVQWWRSYSRLRFADRSCESKDKNDESQDRSAAVVWRARDFRVSPSLPLARKSECSILNGLHRRLALTSTWVCGPRKMDGFDRLRRGIGNRWSTTVCQLFPWPWTHAVPRKGRGSIVQTNRQVSALAVSIRSASVEWAWGVEWLCYGRGLPRVCICGCSCRW